MPSNQQADSMCKALVFLIDDDDAVREAMSMSLKGGGFEVESFASAAGFLQTYRGRFGCIVTDLSMPGMDGLALQQELNRRGVRLPLIFMSGRGTIRDAVKAIKAGAADFLEKPFPRAMLLKSVREAMDEAKNQRTGGCRASVDVNDPRQEQTEPPSDAPLAPSGSVDSRRDFLGGEPRFALVTL